MKLLIVDDETSIAQLLCEVFEEEGFACDYAYSGNAAIDKIKSSNFDLIISDVKMGDGDGPSLLKHVRENNISSKFIFITGHSDYTESDLISQGAMKVYYKPLELDQFILNIKQLTSS